MRWESPSAASEIIFRSSSPARQATIAGPSLSLKERGSFGGNTGDDILWHIGLPRRLKCVIEMGYAFVTGVNSSGDFTSHLVIFQRSCLVAAKSEMFRQSMRVLLEIISEQSLKSPRQHADEMPASSY